MRFPNADLSGFSLVFPLCLLCPLWFDFFGFNLADSHCSSFTRGRPGIHRRTELR